MKIFCVVVTATKVVTSRYMQAAAAKGPMKADRVSLMRHLNPSVCTLLL